jgi:translation initiation factor IF-1
MTESKPARLRRGWCSRVDHAAPSAVEIVDQVRGAGTEGVIEQIQRRGDSVEVRVMLADGTDAMARLAAHVWDWLELRAGDIVAVRATAGVPLSA